MFVEKEMSDWFDMRTRKHLGLVRNHIETLNGLGVLFDGMRDRDRLHSRWLRHDLSKFEEPQRTPYIHITWMYKAKAEGFEYSMPKGMAAVCQAATAFHVLNEDHHPEFWAGEAPISLNDRDAAVTALAIPDMNPVSIAEMVADWKAVGDERGNTARSWYEKVDGTRFLFTGRTRGWIEKCLRILEG